jgi:hypothetical protein
MKLRITLCAIATLGTLMLAAGPARSQEKAKGEAKQAVDMQEMMKKWMEAATPGEPHKLLSQFVGKWDTLTRMWMDGSGKVAAESKGTSDIKWILDGRFLLEESTGQVMGMPYKGMIITGYDNYKKRYVFSYVDNMGTANYTGEGTVDLSGKIMTLQGKMDDPMLGERDKPVKYVTRIVSKDQHVFEIYDLAGTPQEFKAVEIVYTRKP